MVEIIKKEGKEARALQEKIHMEPELPHQEYKTREKVLNTLSGLPVEIKRCSNSAGLIVDMNVDEKFPRIAFRADMDALPIEERTKVSYRSQYQSVMHACGHDFHTAILAGTVRVLSSIRDLLKVNVRFLFQPAEEDNPVGGARDIIQEGGINGCLAVFGLHLWPELDVGEVGVKSGSLFAASDKIAITVKGKSAHAAKPEDGVDAVVIAAHVLVALQTLVSRAVSPMDHVVITMGEIHGGKRYNIIPDKVIINGTVRSVSDATRSNLKQKIKMIVDQTAGMFGGHGVLQYFEGYPSLNNNEELCEFLKGIFTEDKNIILKDLKDPAMIAEDFAYYAQKIPGLFLLLGCSREDLPKENRSGLHSPYFQADQACIEKGLYLFTQIALSAHQLCKEFNKYS